MSGTYYFKALKVTALTSGHYTFVSDSTTDLYGWLYDSFRQYSPSSNLIGFNDDGASGGNFKLITYLSTYQSKVLVVTTFSPLTTASFDVKVDGPGVITWENI
ncbi:unnamed protein product [Adineta ricciae]|uniref:Uncharacterized protein n=1 Tax=Adineta ricciae TaxID=249248 RepID=A0A815WK14_ADIRI|nr:unnamed protein product [Adineta ricciae]